MFSREEANSMEISEKLKFCVSPFRITFDTTLKDWMNDPSNREKEKLFKLNCKSLHEDVSTRASLYALNVMHSTDPTKMLISAQFLLKNLRSSKLDEEILTSVIRAIFFFANESLSNRLKLFQQGIVHDVFNRYPSMKDDGARFSCGDLWKSLDQSKTRKRLREMKQYKTLKNAFKKQKPLMAKVLNRKQCAPLVEKLMKEIREKSENGIFCFGCEKKEGEEKFQVCSRCKLVFFCSKDCLKRSWKVKHKQFCKVAAARNQTF